MGRLDLSFLLDSGLYSDVHLACTDEYGNETILKVHRAVVFTQCHELHELMFYSPRHHDEDHGVDVYELSLDPVIFRGLLMFLYSGEYRAVYQEPETQLGMDEQGMWDDYHHSVFYSLRLCSMADRFGLHKLFSESAAAFCTAARNFSFHVDYPAFISELYDTFGNHPQFDHHMISIPRMISRDIVRSRCFTQRMDDLLFEYPKLAIDVLKATMGNLAECEGRLQEAEDRIYDMERSLVVHEDGNRDEVPQRGGQRESRRRHRHEEDLNVEERGEIGDGEEDIDTQPTKRRRVM
ncbi:uncharacterized protein CTRU02_206095 [Colletotrichum truncatum]|uniref:Uncharacterized protein n=1 Tax=Colletotrichum truncatum TaxID=5467 RepID=A0ACC3Z5Z8_COLTU|nr:uncharacterized protein CTRU02_10492 [Colletotrichum truncatum]KAF6787229.1 hypothetical protein CTRU02_10492 [Colletotrichum truncatum]